MKIRLSALVLLPALCISNICIGAETRAVVPIQTFGNMNCENWSTLRHDDNKSPAAPEANWMLGYISGFAVASATDILKMADQVLILNYVDDFCASNPKRSVGESGWFLYSKLKTALPQ